MRICFVTPEYALEPPFGGIATYTRDAAKWLTRQGHQVTVVCITDQKKPNVIVDDGVSLYFVPPIRMRPRSLLHLASFISGFRFLYEAYAGWGLLERSVGAWQCVRRLDRTTRFDVIECADFGGLAFLGIFCGFQERTLLRGHGYLDLDLPHVTWAGRRFQHFLEKYCIQHSKLIVTMSRLLGEIYQRKFEVNPNRVVTIPSGIDLTLFSAYKVGQSAYLKDGPPTFVYVGRIEYEKGADILFQALLLAHERLPTLKAVLAGHISPNAQSAFDDFIGEAHQWCTHMGHVNSETVYSLMHSATALIFPSRTDTLPRTVIEAQFCGLPQIASKVGGIPEIVIDGETGILVDIENVQLFVEAMYRLAVSCDRDLNTMRERSRACANERFGIDAVMMRQVEIYQRLAK